MRNLYLIVVISSIHHTWGAFFDYTDFDDPLQLLWNTRNQVRQDPNSPCLGNVGSNPMEGVCKSRTECQLSGGVSGGSCGFVSTCCVYAGRCGSKFSSKISFFQGIGSRTNQASSCTYQVQLHNRNICQLRLDFTQLHLAPPTQVEPAGRTCREEKFFVEGHPEVPQICGENSGQHMYINVNGNDSTPVKLHIDLQQQPLDNRRWNIKITQLYCPGTSVFPYRTQMMLMANDFLMLAPQNCLQYFTDRKGSFRSFGFDALNPETSAYNVNQSYAICFKRSINGVCGISYTADYFKVGTTPSVLDAAPGDYLYVPALRKYDNFRDERVSGEPDLNKHFTSVTPGPLYVYFSSDSTPDADGRDSGFNIRYELATSCS